VTEAALTLPQGTDAASPQAVPQASPVATPVRFEIVTLQWAVGGYCAGLGTLMLILPHGFDDPAFASLRPVLALSGVLLLMAGIGLVSVAILFPRRPLRVAAHLVAGGGLMLLAVGFFINGSWSAFLNQAWIALCSGLAPFLTHLGRRERVPVPLLGPMLGGSLLILGVTTFIFGGPVFMPRPALLSVYGSAFLFAGAALLAFWLAPAPHRVRQTACLFAGAALLAWMFAGTLQARLWMGILFFGGFGFALLLLPWGGPRLARSDRPQLWTHLALTFSLLAIVPLIGMTAWLTHQSEQATRHDLLVNQRMLAEATARSVNEYLVLHRAAVIGIAGIPGLLNLPREQQVQLLREYDVTYPEIFLWTLADQAGTTLATADDLPRPDLATVPAFQAVRDANQPLLGVHIGSTTGRPQVVLAAPIHDETGRFLGALFATLETRQVAEIVRGLNTDDARLMYLVDDAGRAVAHTDRRVEPLTSLVAAPPVAQFLADPTRSAALTYAAPAGAIGGEGERLAAFAPVGAFGWAVMIERPSAHALRAFRDGREQTLLILLLTLVLAVAGAIAFARYLTRPVGQLAHAADGLATGQVRDVPPPVGIHELDRLGAAFAAMQADVVSRELFRLAVEAIHGMVFDWDLKTGATYRSPGLEELVGYRPDEAEPTFVLVDGPRSS
jgi:PAS domain-containing protein